MAIAFRSGSALAAGDRTNSTITAPTGDDAYQDDDGLLISIIEYATGGYPSPAMTPPSGFDEVPNSPISHNAFNVYTRHHVYEKRASSESGDYTFTHSSRGTEAWIGGWSGCVASGSFLDVDPTANNGTGSTSTGSSITTNTDGAVIVLFEHDYYDTTGGNTAPSGMTERFDSATGGLGFMYAADVTQSSAGASGNKSFTNNNTDPSSVWAAFLVALKPTSTEEGVGSVAGVGAATGIGTGIIASAGSSAGSGAASGVGAASTVFAGSSTGSGAASGVGASNAASAGSAAGTGSASGVGAPILVAVGSAAGSSAASATGAGINTAGAGAAAGTSTASGGGGSIVPCAGSASGTSSCIAQAGGMRNFGTGALLGWDLKR